MNKSSRKNKGYTLIEFMVAAFVFLSATTVIFGTFTHTIRANRDANDMIVVNTDAAIITEMITREVRLGYNFNTSGSAGCPLGATHISFTRESPSPTTEPPANVEYRWNNDTIQRRENSGSWAPINSSKTNVDSFCFVVTQGGSDHPWRVTSIFSLEPQSGRIAPVNFQTTISSRTLPGDIN